jgi:hypothetical protein
MSGSTPPLSLAARSRYSWAKALDLAEERFREFAGDIIQQQRIVLPRSRVQGAPCLTYSTHERAMQGPSAQFLEIASACGEPQRGQTAWLYGTRLA